MKMTSCRYFSGYKPCGRSTVCDASCSSVDLIQKRVLIVHLGAIGAVVRATALLRSVHDKYPGSHITWVTDAPSHQLLSGHPLIDRVLTTSFSDILTLGALEFDVCFVVDKSLKAAGVLASTQAKEVFGFVADSTSGAILPATGPATELWEIGLSDELKFFENKKTEIQLLIEALELGPWTQQDYDLPLTPSENELVLKRKALWSDGGKKKVIGLNTGCSPVIPYKKLTIDRHRELAMELFKRGYQVVLLGGPEDQARNQQIANELQVIQSPTSLGLRDGYVSVAACDVVISGDSLGMHLAIAAKVGVVAWFGPTCSHEIELYGRGIAIEAEVTCSPCWKRSCEKAVMCYDQVSLDQIMSAVNTLAERSEISFVPSVACDSLPL